jgi:hypothetical protein
LKVSVGCGLSTEPLCIECGEHLGIGELAVGLYTESPNGHPGNLRLLGEFCSGCAGRFTKNREPSAGPFDPGISVSPPAAREAALRAAKRLRELARDLETAEYGVG